MATSFVEMDGHGFWCRDSLLEIWSFLMSELLRTANAQGLSAYGDYLHIQATGGFHGCVDFRLDDLDAQTREEIVRQSVRLLDRLSARPELLTATQLNRLGLGGGQGEYVDVPVEHMRALTEHIIMLLRGEWRWRAGDKESLPGQWLE